MAVIFVITLSSIATYLVYTFLLKPFNLTYLNTIVFILLIAALVQLVEMFMKKSMKSLYSSLGVYLPLITTNCAVLGVAITNIQKEFTFAEAIVNSVGTALGFAIAIIILAGIREKIENNNILPSLKGTPITLIISGLMAIAFTGFAGLL